MSFNINQTIANYAAEHLSGIPWNELAKTAPDGDPFFSPDYLYKYMGPAWEAAKAVIDTLEFDDIEWDSSAALEAFSKMKAASSRVEGGVVQAIQANALTLGYEVMQFDVLTLKMYILDVYLTALNGFNYHGHWLPQTWISQGATSEAEMEQRQRDGMDHATLVITMFETIVKLDKFHILDPIKKGGAQAGLGIAPVLLVVLAVGAVAGIALLMWGLASLVDVSQKNKILEKICLKTNDATVLKRCVEAAEKSSFQPDFGAMMSGVTKWLVAGGLVVGAVYFAPLIVTKLSQARKAARTAA